MDTKHIEDNESIGLYYLYYNFTRDYQQTSSVSSATINRFFSLHFPLPFILAALVAGHLLYLHVSGSSNPVGTTSNADRTAFHPYFSFKDLVTVYLFFIIFTAIIFYAPDKLGHSDNYIEANSMQTPASIKIYLLFIIFIISLVINLLLIYIILYKNKSKPRAPRAAGYKLISAIRGIAGNNFNNNNFNNKEDILKKIELLKCDIELTKNYELNDFDKFKNFKYLANGVFQAEGHIGGYFIKGKLLNFRPVVFIGLTVNIESLKFFVLLNNLFKFKMGYSIEKLPSGKFFIKLISRD
jgi:Cytochrome b(N-terminal)/b6/petB